MGWRPRNLNDSLMPFTTLQAILGYAVFQYPIGKQRVLFSIIYTIIITSIYWLLFAWDLKTSIDSWWYESADKVVCCIIYVNFAIAVVAQILHCYYNREYLRVINRIIKVDETLCELGAMLDYSKQMYVGLGTIVFWLLIATIQSVIGILWYSDRIALFEKIIVVAVSCHPFRINMIVFLNCALIISEIKVRFRKANDLLEDAFSLDKKRSMIESMTTIFQNKVTAISSVVSNERKLNNHCRGKSLVLAIKHVHLELTRIAKKLNCIYGVIILFEMAASFILFTGLLYILYIMAMSSTTERRTVKIIIVIMMIFTTMPILISINHVCEAATSEARRTCQLIHRIGHRSDDLRFLDEIRQFSLQVSANPLLFSPMGFFTLGYSFIRGFIRTVVTYLVILIQMGPISPVNLH